MHGGHSARVRASRRAQHSKVKRCSTLTRRRELGGAGARLRDEVVVLGLVRHELVARHARQPQRHVRARARHGRRRAYAPRPAPPVRPGSTAASVRPTRVETACTTATKYTFCSPQPPGAALPAALAQAALCAGSDACSLVSRLRREAAQGACKLPVAPVNDAAGRQGARLAPPLRPAQAQGPPASGQQRPPGQALPRPLLEPRARARAPAPWLRPPARRPAPWRAPAARQLPRPPVPLRAPAA